MSKVKQFYFPKNETKFGQTFLCVSLTKSDIHDAAKQLLYNTPFVYYSTITAADAKEYPALGKVFAGHLRLAYAPWPVRGNCSHRITNGCMDLLSHCTSSATYNVSFNVAHQPPHDIIHYKVLNKEWLNGPASHVARIGKFTSFAKNGDWGNDLWADLVGLHFKSDLLVSYPPIHISKHRPTHMSIHIRWRRGFGVTSSVLTADRSTSSK